MPRSLFFLLLAGLCACASAPRRAEGPPPSGERLRVAFIDYRSGQRLELVSRSHTDPLEQYSEVRADAARKVQTDEVMDALADFLRENGFGERSRPGPAPLRPAQATVAWGMELEEGGATYHALASRGDPGGELRRFKEWVDAFVAIYNATYGLQAVEVKEGEQPFERPLRIPEKRR